MRILISTPWLGGIGGIERNVSSTIRCLGARHEIDVCAGRVIDSEYLARPARGRVVPGFRWKVPDASHRVVSRLWPLVSPVVRYRPDPYDAYFHYFGAPVLHDRFAAQVSIIVPSGRSVRDLEEHFDVVAMQAPDNVQYTDDVTKAVLLPPPVDVTAAVAEPVPGLVDEFFLTIFNPHTPRKGLDDLRAVAARSCLPIVWCRSTRTRPLGAIPEIPNVVVLEDLSQAQLRFLYERCRAYVEFTHDMGFGWTVADALQFGAPVISRRRGVLTLTDVDTAGVFAFEDLDGLTAFLRRDDYPRVTRDVGALRPERFVDGFEQVVDGRRAP